MNLPTRKLNLAMLHILFKLIVRHGEPAPFFCNKDPFTLKSSLYLHKLFPNAKFILMIRDARAVVHSIITRKVTISGFNLSNFSECLQVCPLSTAVTVLSFGLFFDGYIRYFVDH